MLCDYSPVRQLDTRMVNGFHSLSMKADGGSTEMDVVTRNMERASLRYTVYHAVLRPDCRSAAGSTLDENISKRLCETRSSWWRRDCCFLPARTNLIPLIWIPDDRGQDYGSNNCGYWKEALFRTTTHVPLFASCVAFSACSMALAMWKHAPFDSVSRKLECGTKRDRPTRRFPMFDGNSKVLRTGEYWMERKARVLEQGR